MTKGTTPTAAEHGDDPFRTMRSGTLWTAEQPGAQRSGPPGSGRRWLSWRRVLLMLGLLVLLVLLAPTSLVNPIAARRMASSYEEGCAELVGVQVDSGAWPVVFRAMIGKFRDVSAEIDEIRFDTFSIHDVRISAAEVEVVPLGLSVTGGDAKVRGGETRGAMSFEDLEEIFAEYDVTLTLRRDDVDDSRLIADVEVPFLGTVPTAVEIVPVEGDLELRLAPLDVFELPPIQVTAEEPFEVQAVKLREDAVQIDSTFQGSVSSSGLGCDVTTD